MPSFGTRKVHTRSKSQATQHQQISTAAEGVGKRNEQTFGATGRSRPSRVAARGVKRKRVEPSASSDEADSDDRTVKDSSVLPAGERRDRAGPDQHTVKAAAPDGRRRSGRNVAKPRSSQANGQPTSISTAGGSSAPTASDAPVSAAKDKAAGTRQTLSPSGQRSRAATNAAVAAAAAFFGAPRTAASQKPPSAPFSLAVMVPPGRFCELLSCDMCT